MVAWLRNPEAAITLLQDRSQSLGSTIERRSGDCLAGVARQIKTAVDTTLKTAKTDYVTPMSAKFAQQIQNQINACRTAARS